MMRATRRGLWLALPLGVGALALLVGTGSDRQPSNRSDPDEIRRLEIFQAVVDSSSHAAREVEHLAPDAERTRLPFAPAGAEKTGEKRAGLTGASAAKTVRQVAAENGITVAEVEAIVQQGRREGWD